MTIVRPRHFKPGALVRARAAQVEPRPDEMQAPLAFAGETSSATNTQADRGPLRAQIGPSEPDQPARRPFVTPFTHQPSKMSNIKFKTLSDKKPNVRVPVVTAGESNKNRVQPEPMVFAAFAPDIQGAIAGRSLNPVAGPNRSAITRRCRVAMSFLRDEPLLCTDAIPLTDGRSERRTRSLAETANLQTDA